MGCHVCVFFDNIELELESIYWCHIVQIPHNMWITYSMWICVGSLFGVVGQWFCMWIHCHCTGIVLVCMMSWMKLLVLPHYRCCQCHEDGLHSVPTGTSRGCPCMFACLCRRTGLSRLTLVYASCHLPEVCPCIVLTNVFISTQQKHLSGFDLWCQMWQAYVHSGSV